MTGKLNPEERLFIVDEIPDDEVSPFSITDTYLAIEKSIHGINVVRVRHQTGPVSEKFKQRIDRGKDRSEIRLTEDNYNNLRGHCGRTIVKERSMIRDKGWSTGVDLYRGEPLGGLALAGVRPQGNTPLEEFTPYDWMGSEVTGEVEFYDFSMVDLDKGAQIFGEREY